MSILLPLEHVRIVHIFWPGYNTSLARLELAWLLGFTLGSGVLYNSDAPGLEYP